ncbi:MAG: MFS transporter [Chloroflexi bacterium]|nr:MFS transporter [Chloroflexota bacterium]
MQNQPKPLPDNWARRFFTIWTGQAFSLFGSALVQFALVWWLAQESGSATVLTLAMLAGLLPQILLGPFAGALVDRGNRRLIMIAADAMIALATLVLLYLFITDQVQVWHVYTIMAIRSLGGAFHFPAMSASTPLMVPKEQLTRINGLNQTLQGLNTIFAPPVGALLISAFSTESVLMIDIATAALAILPLLFIPIPQPVRKAEQAGTEKKSLLQDVREALAYIRAWPGLMAILGMALIINGLLNPASALMPLLVTKYFGKGVLELGFIDTAFGVGMIAGGVILSAWGGFKRKVATAMLGITGIGVGILLVAVAPPQLFLLALTGMAIAGIANPIANGSLFAIVQTVITPEMQGRVMSLIMTFATAITPLSLLMAGPISDSIGIRAWFWIGGIVTVLMGVGGFFSRAVMTVEDNHRNEPAESQLSAVTTD